MYLQQISSRPLRTTNSANSWHYATVRNSSKGAKWDRTQITGEDQDILYQSFQNSDQVKRYQFSKGSRRIRTNSFFKNKIFSRKNSNFYCSYFQFHSKLLDLSPYIEITGRGGFNYKTGSIRERFTTGYAWEFNYKTVDPPRKISLRWFRIQMLFRSVLYLNFQTFFLERIDCFII